MDAKLNIIDRAIALFSPEAGIKRAKARFYLREIQSNLRQYDAATKGRRTDGWYATGASANAEIRPSLDLLRNRSRELVRNNVWAKRAIQAVANNTVGTGIMPAFIGKSKLQKRRMQDAWRDWAETTECDFDDTYNIYGLQKLVMRTVVESGECIVLKRRVASGPGVNPIKLQVCEPDIIDTNKDYITTDSGGYIVQGVEFDSNGRKVAYWLFDQHPGELRGHLNLVSNRVSVSDVIHVKEVLRPGQVRGVPFAHAGMTRMRDFEDYEDAQLLRQKIAACFTAFVTDSSEEVVGGKKNAIERATRLEPGLIEYLPMGKEVTFAQPPATTDYASFSQVSLRGISAAFGITYEALTGDLTGVNFSSGRMGWLEMARNVHDWQYNIMIPMFCSPMFNWFNQGAILAGLVGEGMRCEWTPPRREMIDPVKETTAKRDAITGGLMSWSETVRQDGYDPEELLNEILEERKRFKEAGIPYPGDSGNKSAAPVYETEDDNTDQSKDKNTSPNEK